MTTHRHSFLPVLGAIFAVLYTLAIQTLLNLPSH